MVRFHPAHQTTTTAREPGPNGTTTSLPGSQLKNNIYIIIVQDEMGGIYKCLLSYIESTETCGIVALEPHRSDFSAVGISQCISNFGTRKRVNN